MPLIRAQVVLRSADNNAENDITNTFHFDGPTYDATQQTRIVNALTSAYDVWDTLFSDLLSPSGLIKIYNLDDPLPRAPVAEIPLALTITSGTSMPPEVAVCCSFQGPRVSGQSQARRRGRIYLGPLRSAFLGTTGRPASTTAPTIVNGAAPLLQLNVLGGIADMKWVVSSTFGGRPVITNGWVDNEFDTQRRRGRKYTVRTVW
jgi:hypothetical protein